MAWRFGGYRRTFALKSGWPVIYGKGKTALRFGRVGQFPQARAGMVPGRTRIGGYYGRYRATRRYAQNGRRGRMGELKFHDLDIDDAVIASNGTIVDSSVNNIPQGVTEVTRVGRKCTIRSINWRFHILLPNSANMAAGTNDTVRVILYLDKQCNGAAAAVTDILESDNYQSFNNLANKSRFRILMDRKYQMNAQAGSGDGTSGDAAGVQYNDALYKKVNLPIEFDSTTGALTEIRSNNIGVMLLSKVGICLFESKMRLRFSDS